MASNSKTQMKFEIDVLKCCSCSTLFDEDIRHPHLLPCLHSICYQCLQAKIKSNSNIKCRFCEEEIDFSNKTVDQFPKDETKSGCLKLYKLKSSENYLQCQECEDEQTAEFLCETCSKQLCKDCYDHHKRAKRSHVLYSLQDMPLTFDSVKKFSTARKCQMKGHDGENLTFYCKSCQQIVCSRCILIAHKEGHHVEELHKVYETEVKKLEKENIALSVIENKIDNIVESAELEIVNVDKTSNKLISEIEAAFQKQLSILVSRKNELMKELKQNCKLKTTRLNGQILQLKREKHIVTCTQSFINLALSTADSVSLIDTYPFIIQKTSRIHDTPIDMAPCEKPALDFCETSLVSTSLLGKLISTSIYGPRTQITLPKESFVGKETEIKVELFDYHGNVVNDEELHVLLEIHDSNNTVVDKISCQLQDKRTWSCKTIFASQGRYEMKVTVLGLKLEMKAVGIEIESLPVLESAQVPIYEFKRMNNNSTMQITNLQPGMSDEDIIHYFQNNKESGGGKIHKFSRVENVVFITFEDQNVLREVLTKWHWINMKILITSQYNGPVLDVPHPIVLKNIDKTKMVFVQDSKRTRDFWEQNLENMFAKIVWPHETQNETLIYCTLTVDIPNCATLVEKWQQDIISFVSRLADQLIVKQMSVHPYLWTKFIDALQCISIQNPETVSVVLSRERNNIQIVGYKNNVTELEAVVKNAYEKVKISYENRSIKIFKKDFN